MEKLNLNFNGGDNIIKSICWIMSVLSWLLLIITGWISLRWLDDDTIGNRVWYIFKREATHIVKGKKYTYYAPLQMQASLIYIVFILTMIIVLVGFIIYMIKSTCKKDDAVYNGMMGQWSKFHFFPLLCISAMFIAGENYDNISDDADSDEVDDHLKGIQVSVFVFDIIGLASLIFIYIMTDLNTDWYILLTLKKGTYSCFITLLWYYFCYAIYYLRSLDEDEYERKHPHGNKNFKLGDWSKGCGIAFSIIFGIGSLAFAFVFKDLVVAGMNMLIYIGLTAYYFEIHKDDRKKKSANENGDGAVDIIMMVFSLCLLVFLILTKREECLKS